MFLVNQVLIRTRLQTPAGVRQLIYSQLQTSLDKPLLYVGTSRTLQVVLLMIKLMRPAEAAVPPAAIGVSVVKVRLLALRACAGAPLVDVAQTTAVMVSAQSSTL